MDFDIFNPPKTKVVAGVEGKTILVYSAERKLGKTLQASRMPKPFYLRFEQGANAIPDMPYAPLTCWADFKKVNKVLTDPRKLSELKNMYETIIFDTIDVAINWCTDYVCAQYGVQRIKDGNNGYGLWSEYANEWTREINKLTNAGYTIYFIAHAETRKRIDPKTKEEYEQLYPKGDKRTIDPIIDLVDFIGYVKSNGLDENNVERPSSIFFANTKSFLAGSRFDMPTEINPFTAENLQKAIKEAVQKNSNGKKEETVTRDELVKEEDKINHHLSYDELVKQIKDVGKHVDVNIAKKIFEDYLGEGKKLSDATDKQTQQLEMILEELKENVKS